MKKKILKLGERGSLLEQRILYHALPSLLLPLIRKGEIKERHLCDLGQAWTLLVRRIRFATAHMEWVVSLESTFAKEANAAWKRGEKEIAIVLLAVAIEQCLNGVLRSIIESRGFERVCVTNLLRSQNIEPKLTWVFEMHSGKTLPKAIFIKCKKIFEIRNALVHFKAIPGRPDKEEDSYSKIRNEIKFLSKFRPDAFFQRFENFCWSVVREKVPAIELACNLRGKMMPYKAAYSSRN